MSPDINLAIQSNNILLPLGHFSFWEEGNPLFLGQLSNLKTIQLLKLLYSTSFNLSSFLSIPLAMTSYYYPTTSELINLIPTSYKFALDYVDLLQYFRWN